MTPVYSSFGLETYFYDEDTETFHFPDQGIVLTPLAGDPSGPTNGQLWYSSAIPGVRARINGVTYTLATGTGSSVAYTRIDGNGDIRIDGNGDLRIVD